ncbi:MAG: DUF2892 domain-containing protein [Haloarculaceae archaeon]
MNRNVGSVDRAVRIAVGAVLAVAGLLAIGGYWEAGLAAGAVGVLAGVVLVATGATQQCPMYAATGVSTADDAE